MSARAAVVALPYIAEPLRRLAVPLGELDSLVGNPRRGDVEAVKRSYSQFGQRKPIVARHKADGRGEVTAGNTQLAAAGELGWSHIAVVWADDDDLTAKAWALADNRTSELGLYDEDALVAYLQAVSTDAELLAATGYSESDLARLLGTDAAAPDDKVLEPPPVAFTQPGDVWLLGPHRLVCGDATDRGVLAETLRLDVAPLVIADPPYGVEYDGGTVERRKLIGDDARGAALDRLYDVAFTGAALCEATALMLWHDPRASAAYDSIARAGWEIRGQLIWLKNIAQFGALSAQYHQKHETAFTVCDPVRLPRGTAARLRSPCGRRIAQA